MAAADPLSSDFYSSANTANAPPDRAIPRFYMSAVVLPKASEDAGHAVYEDREFVEIRMPGDRSYSFISEVSDEYRQRFPQAYAAFKGNKEVPLDGTPIDFWPPLTPSQVLNFKAMNVLTVEDLATLPDGALQAMGLGARDLRTKALAWLTSARDNAAAMRLATKTEELEAELARRDSTIRDLAARLDALEAKRASRKRPDDE